MSSLRDCGWRWLVQSPLSSLLARMGFLPRCQQPDAATLTTDFGAGVPAFLPWLPTPHRRQRRDCQPLRGQLCVLQRPRPTDFVGRAASLQASVLSSPGHHYLASGYWRYCCNQ